MKLKLHELLKLLSGRVALNIYLWAFIIIPRINIKEPLFIHLYAASLYGLLIALVYFNNLILAPKLLAKKKWTMYLIFSFVYCYIISFVYTYVLKSAVHQYPELNINRISIFIGPEVNGIMTFSSTSGQSLSYFAMYYVLMFIFTLAWYRIDYFRQQELQTKLQQQQLETELQLLRGQLNPHFLFNTLNNLYGLALYNKAETPEAILKLSSILRYFLYESNTEKMSFSKEAEIMQAYIELELLRILNKEQLKFDISCDGDYEVPALLWLPVLENAFKHGTRFIGYTPAIDFSCTIENNCYIIHCSNKYNCKKEDAGETLYSGIGLNNLKQRLDISYPGKHSIETIQNNNYYTTTVKISLS